MDSGCDFIHCESFVAFSDESLEAIRECFALPECNSFEEGDVEECLEQYDCG